MTYLSKLKTRFDERGLAALEFAFILPILAMMTLGLAELTLRYQGVEKFHRYVSQAGDLLSRTNTLESEDVRDIHQSASKMMNPIRVGDDLTLTVTSIGFDSTGTPKILWQRTEPDGRAHLPVSASDAVGLGYPGDTVVRTDARFFYSSAISTSFGFSDVELNRKIYYRPRTTRVISMDEAVSENGDDWDDISSGSEEDEDGGDDGDHDNGHGNDEDGYDESNPGNSDGVGGGNDNSGNDDDDDDNDRGRGNDDDDDDNDRGRGNDDDDDDDDRGRGNDDDDDDDDRGRGNDDDDDDNDRGRGNDDDDDDNDRGRGNDDDDDDNDRGRGNDDDDDDEYEGRRGNDDVEEEEEEEEEEEVRCNFWNCNDRGGGGGGGRGQTCFLWWCW
ncbi:MAG: pilus assembly protein [Hyphomonadaceae bacterium]|nr:pilus assembly protein [Hyphomonadaceae bacterium]